MRSSSSLVAPSAVAILSMSLLCSLSGTAVSQTATGSAAPLPSITVDAPKQVARPNRPVATPQGSGRVAHRAGRTSRSSSNSDWDAVGCAGSCHGEACPARERGQQLQRWLRIKLQTRQGPLGWMQRIGGVLLSFLSNVQRHTHPQGLRAMRGNQNVPGLGPTTILVVLHRHAGWGEISGHRRESKQVAHCESRLNSGQLNHVSFVFGQPDRNVVAANTISIQGSIPPTRAQPKSVSGQSRHFGRRPTTSGLPL